MNTTRVIWVTPSSSLGEVRPVSYTFLYLPFDIQKLVGEGEDGIPRQSLESAKQGPSQRVFQMSSHQIQEVS